MRHNQVFVDGGKKSYRIVINKRILQYNVTEYTYIAQYTVGEMKITCM